MNTIYIPVELCQYALKNKLIRPLQIYITLKIHCFGIIKLKESDKFKIMQLLEVSSVKTIDNNLRVLLNLNWIGYNDKTGWYFIRGFGAIKNQYGFRRRTVAEFSSLNIKDFKAFAIGAVIGSLINSQKRKIKEGERRKGRSLQPSLIFFPVACEVLSRILEISKSTALGYKILALNAGFIDIKKQYINVGISSRSLQSFRMIDFENNKKAILKNGQIVFRGIDLVISKVQFKRGKKPNYI